MCVFLYGLSTEEEEELDYSWAPQIGISSRGQSSYTSCITATYNPGTCVPVPECPAAVNILRRGSLSAKNRQILQRSLCHAFEKKYPVVCCSRPSSPRDAEDRPSRRPPAEPLPPPTRRPPPDPRPSPTRRPPEDPLPEVPLQPTSDNSLENHVNARLLPINDCGKSLEGKIFGGEEASLYDFPWMALLKYRVGCK